MDPEQVACQLQPVPMPCQVQYKPNLIETLNIGCPGCKPSLCGLNHVLFAMHSAGRFDPEVA